MCTHAYVRTHTYVRIHAHNLYPPAPRSRDISAPAPAITLSSSSSSDDDDDGDGVIDLTEPTKMKLAALKKALKAHNLKTSGRKADLCRRLQRALEETGGAAAAAKVRALGPAHGCMGVYMC